MVVVTLVKIKMRPFQQLVGRGMLYK